jgi:hypothetical protein
MSKEASENPCLQWILFFSSTQHGWVEAPVYRQGTSLSFHIDIVVAQSYRMIQHYNFSKVTPGSAKVKSAGARVKVRNRKK